MPPLQQHQLRKLEHQLCLFLQVTVNPTINQKAKFKGIPQRLSKNLRAYDSLVFIVSSHVADVCLMQPDPWMPNLTL